MSSMTISTSDFRTDSTSSVQTTSLGTHGCFFLLDIAIADVRQTKRMVAALAQNFRDGPADSSEADQRNRADGSFLQDSKLAAPNLRMPFDACFAKMRLP